MIINLPAGLDLDRHLIKYPPVSVKDFKRDKLAYLLHLIIDIPSKNKDIREIGGGWVPIYTPIVRNLIRDYSAYLKYALGEDYPNDSDAAILISDNHYIPGEKSKWYSFAARYISLSGELLQLELTDKKLIKKLNRRRSETNKAVIKMYPLLTGWFKGGLKIDGERARSYAIRLRDEALQQIAIDEVTGKLGAKEALNLRTRTYNRHLIYLNGIDSIEKEDFFFSVDDTGRRLHTNLTNMKKEFRNFLSFNGQTLVSIDIKNAQPYLSLALLRPSFYAPPTEAERVQLGLDYTSGLHTNLLRPSRSLKLCNIAPELYTRMLHQPIMLKSSQKYANKKILKQSNINKVDSLIMYSDSLQYADTQDVDKYKQTVIDGTFYDSFAEAVSTKMNKDWKRSDAKKAMFITFFSDNRFISSPEAEPKALFKELYPTIYELFYKIKSKDKPALAVLLQSAESWLMLDVICKRIAREKPHIPLFTIHDSLITTSEHEAYVKAVMESAFERHIGCKPSLDISYFLPENLQGSSAELLEGEILLNEALSVLSSQYIS